MDPDSKPSRAGLRNRRNGPAIVATFFALAMLATTVAWAFVHDGKSFAIEAALEKLELSENPFVLREEWWDGKLVPGDTKILQHQLFKRNEYWFWVGCSIEDATVSVHLYDSNGTLVDAESFQKGNVSGARIIPKTTGSYYIRVAVEKSTVSPAEWAVIYAYR